MKILLVDDDSQLTRLIGDRLKQDNFQVEVTTTGEQAIALLQANPYSLVLLDVILPNLSGVEVCEQLRYQGDQTPILMLTGQEQTQDKVLALDAGADDYLVKPFELDELTARVRALLRRNTQASMPRLCYEALVFDPSTQSVTYNGQPVELRPKEMAILELILRYPTQIFNADAFLDRLWNLAECPSRDTVKTHMRSLRKQLALSGAQNIIQTLYGRGYRLSPTLLEQPVMETKMLREPALPAKEASGVMAARTWQQVQSVAWHRLTRLKALVRSLHTSTDHQVSSRQSNGRQSNDRQSDGRQSNDRQSNDRQSDEHRWKSDCKKAIALAHQLKGNLGSFGFQSASVQARHVEARLSVMFTQKESALKPSVVEDCLAGVNQLQQILQPHMTEVVISPEQATSLNANAASVQSVLVVARDESWIAQLQKASRSQAFKIAVRSPTTINTYLIEQTPALILLEITTAELETDLSLIEALVSNYGDCLPVLALINSDQTKEQLLAIQHGAVTAVCKEWSPHTLLTVTSEYIGAGRLPVSAIT